MEQMAYDLGTAIQNQNVCCHGPVCVIFNPNEVESVLGSKPGGGGGCRAATPLGNNVE